MKFNEAANLIQFVRRSSQPGYLGYTEENGVKVLAPKFYPSKIALRTSMNVLEIL